jgi:hypothetical protein
MNVKELLDKCDDSVVCKEWDKRYKNINKYKEYPSTHIPKFMSLLRDIPPKKTDFSIVVKPITNNEEEYISVSGIKEGSDESWAMELSKNAEWLAFEIDDQIPYKHTVEELFCHILWEMSFMGWFDEERQTFIDSLNSQCEDIERWKEEGTIDEHTTAIDDIGEWITKKFGDDDED